MAAAGAPTSDRPRLLQAGIDAFSQPDVRGKIMFTVAMLLIFRFVAHVPVPGVDRDTLQATFDNNAILGFLNIFSGGALENLSVAALGVYPYITATIVMQLAVPLIPRLQALQQEGESGRQRIQLYQHWITVPLAAVQGYAQLLLIQQLGGVSGIGFSGDNALPTIATILSMIAGTMFLVWLGELITERGVGNGVSLIIFGGIVAGLPGLIGRGVLTGTGAALGGILLLVAVAVAVVALIVYFQEAQRRISVQYARSSIKGGRMYRQQGQSHIPLRVNSAGMIPLIFAFSFMLLPGTIASYFESIDITWVESLAGAVATALSPGNFIYWVFTFILVIAFTYFYTLVVFQQQNLAENLQKNGGFVPGIRPGRPTQQYLMRVVNRLTLAGALFLGFVAVLPFVAQIVTNVNAVAISSTGLLIVVGVVLDTMRQLEAQLLMRNYEGFIR